MEKEHLKKQEYHFLWGCFVFVPCYHVPPYEEKKNMRSFCFVFIHRLPHSFAGLAFTSRRAIHIRDFLFFFFFQHKIINIIILNGHLVFVSFPYGRHLLTFVCV